MALTVLDDQGWVRVCDVAGLDTAWRDWPLARRRAEHDTIDTALAAWTRRCEPGWIEATLTGPGLAVAAVADAPAVMADPQLRAREFFVAIDHPEAGEHEWPGLAVRLADTPATYRRPAGTLNQHATEILTELAGLTSERIGQLRQAGVISDHPPA